MIFQKPYRKHDIILFVLCSILFFLVGCGSDESAESVKRSDDDKILKEAGVGLPSPQLLHETGIDTFAMGISSDDPAAIMQGISLLEQATLASPDEDAYWLDLADAYMASGNVLQYPYAVEIYWMLYQENNTRKDALLTRLIEAYAMAWLCKALGKSGRLKYLPLLKQVASDAPSRKLKGYAQKSVNQMQ